jgi:acetyl esterase/lipase
MNIDRRTFVGAGSMAVLASSIPAAITRAATQVGNTAGGDPLAHVAPELRPGARKMLAMGQMPQLSDAVLPSVRAKATSFGMPPRADVPVEQHKVPVGGDAGDVLVYVINAKPGAQRPAILHTHGGGFILGSAKQEVLRLQDFATSLDCTIVSVEYDLAPEARITKSLEQNYAGLRWLYQKADMLGVDRSRIAVMGESAGGGHAALLAFAARDRGEVPLVFQLLVYPMLDDRTGSTRQLPPQFGSVGWDAASNRFGWRALLGMDPGSAAVPRALVPSRRTDLAGLPPAFIGVGGIDLFASEDIDYARRLLDVGVPTELIVVPGAFHGFDAIAADTKLAMRFNTAKHEALRRAFSPA